MKLQIFLNRFSENTEIPDFMENPSSEGWVVPCGRTDEHDEANNRSQQFYERA